MGRGRLIAIHSYRGGTGKSTITANLALCAMEAGRRVAVLDTDLQSPGIHVLFGFQKDEFQLTLVDFLWGKCSIAETAYDVRDRLNPAAPGRCWLVPASLTAHAITRIIDEGYDVNLLNSHFQQLVDEFELDFLLIDTHPGLNRETLLTTALADCLLMIIRPDQQDYHGSAVIAEIARKLELPRTCLVINKLFSFLDEGVLAEKLEQALHAPVIGAIPLSEDLARLESRDLICRSSPDHPVSQRLRDIAARLFEA